MTAALDYKSCNLNERFLKSKIISTYSSLYSFKPYISDFVQEKFVPEVRLARTLVMAMAELRLFVNQIKEIGTL